MRTFHRLVNVEAVLAPQAQIRLDFKDGTGKFAKLKGAGTLHIKPASPTDRRFILDGEVASAP